MKHDTQDGDSSPNRMGTEQRSGTEMAGDTHVEDRLARLGRLYEVVNTAIEAILQANSPADLYRRLCDASVEQSKFLATTVYLLEPGGTRLIGVASTGPIAQEVIGIYVSVDENLPEGRGIMGTAIRTGKSQVSNDILGDARLRPWWDLVRESGANAVIALPLLQSGRSIGVLVYHSGVCGEFDDELVRLLERIEKNVSYALDSFDRKAERDRAEAATIRASRMYAALSATNEAIMRVSSAEDLFQKVCEAGIKGANFIGIAVLLPDADKRWLRVVASSGPAVENLHKLKIATDERLPEGQGPSGVAFRSGKSWACNDFLNDPRSGPWLEVGSAMGVASNAAVPFMRNGQAAGVLLCFSGETGTFDEEIILLLERLTENVAFALDNFDRAADRTRSEERIQYLATHDALTGLPNRLMFTELLSAALQSARRYGRRFAVLFVDLDRFKIINDTLGHEAGDSLLREITARFKEALRSSDVVARLGGDEFVVLVQEVDDNTEIATVGRKLLSEAIRPVTLSGQECRVTASIGIAVYPGDGEDEQALMKNADIAMYLAKEEGKNNFQFFSPEIKTQSIGRFVLERNLRHALERGEFFLHYQAKLDLGTGMINGVEALLRWNSSELGILSPAQFIPVAEETGLIVQIGRWVLKTACAQNVTWQRAGMSPVCVSVNLSPHQFADENLVNDLDHALSSSGLDPKLLELEITESMVMGNIERVAKQFSAIKQRGVRLAIDNFGTGYSSLAQIKQFPIDTIKVDRSFIKEMKIAPADRGVAKAIIAMGKTLSITVVAEGVETKEQQALLVENGCDEIQGSYFRKPVSSDEFFDLTQQNHASLKCAE